jgi:hypothetical protein
MAAGLHDRAAMLFRASVVTLLTWLVALQLQTQILLLSAARSSPARWSPPLTSPPLTPPAPSARAVPPVPAPGAPILSIAPRMQLVELRRDQLARAAPGCLPSDMVRAPLERDRCRGFGWVPSVRGGRPLGVSFFVKDPGSWPALLGLQTGDRLLAVDDLELRDDWSWIPALGRLSAAADSSERFVDLDLERGGERWRVVALIH